MITMCHKCDGYLAWNLDGTELFCMTCGKVQKEGILPYLIIILTIVIWLLIVTNAESWFSGS